MTSRDGASRITIAQALRAIVVNNDTEGKGATIDTQGHEACTIVASVGASGDTLSGSVKHDFKLQHSDTTTDGDFTDVVDDEYVVGQTPNASTGVFLTIDDAAEDDVEFKVGYVGPKRYVRLVDDTTGTHTNGTPMAAIAVLGHSRHLP